MISRHSSRPRLAGIGLVLVAILASWNAASNRFQREVDVSRSAERNRDELIARLQEEKARLQAGADPVAGPPIVAPGHGLESSPTISRDSQELAPIELVRLIADKTVRLKLKPGLEDVLSPTENGAFPEPFAKLFGLEDAEAARLREGMIAIKERVEALIVARSTVSQKSGSTVVMSFDPLPEGAVLRAELRELMIGIMGQERFGAFLALRSEVAGPGADHVWAALEQFNRRLDGANGIDDFFYAYGLDGAITTVGPGRRPGGYSLHRLQPNPERPPVYTAPQDARDRADLLRLLGPQAALLPAGF